MAYTVEDDSGLAAANSYLSTADADTYHTDHNNATWTGSSAVKEAALRYATQWLDGRYAGHWPGETYNLTQSLAWPRSSAWDNEGRTLSGVPVSVKNAVAELALEHITTALSATTDRRTAREEVGGVMVEYAPGVGMEKKYPHIGRILAPVLATGGTNVIPVRRG